ncbi:hypothetical protein C7M84_017975 [Penaeus vannamei]|uniref:CCHC-type domain-containing protein n=1 Tax=Penaeus vannamei TaxID=6689 RepID=A0A3R7SJV3_PENVA|nr:hypothetical protein C7M84_017975 [Penaeus vannamei]
MPKGKNTGIRRNLRSSSHPSSRDRSPAAGLSISVDQLPIVVGGSNPEVREAVRAMEGEISVLAQILDKIEALSSELSEVKAQTQQFNERLARQEEAVSRPRQPPETQLRFSENPEDYVQRPTFARLPPEPRPRSSPEYADPRLPQGTPQLTAAAQRGSLDDSSTSRALTPAVSYVVARESVPHFKGDTSASQPLKRNQDVEAWIRSIENLVKPPTDEAYIQAARANCRGPAELIINSPLFDFIRDWETFKASLRTKFRGTYTSADFYKVLYENRMSSVQAPMDFYLQLEGHVYQGYRDHREAIGDPSELVRRVFLSGIPSWLRDFLAVKDDCSPMQLAETAQRIWNSRNGIRHESATRHQSPNEFRLDDDRDHRHYPDRPPRARDLYACPIAAQVDRVKTPQLIPPRDPWCSFHGTATHNTSECRAASYVTSARNRPHPSRDITCYRCRRSGHMARQCPFPSGQQGEAPSPAGGVPEGGSNFHQYADRNHNVSDSHVEFPRVVRTASRGTQY